MDNIPNIYSDSYSSNKNDLEIIDLINDDINYLISEKYFNLTNYELINTPNKKYIIMFKTNYKGDFVIDTTDGIFNTYNNRILFPKINEYIIFSLDNEYNKDILDNLYFKQTILILYKFKINNYKYNIINIDIGQISNYYEPLSGNLLFGQKYINDKLYIYCTFTINIFPKNKQEIPKLIKIQSKEYVFIYESQLNSNKMIVLYLIGIKNINTDETIIIDIKFTNIESIYQKYENAIEQINKFLFYKNKKFTYYQNDILKYIKGKIYPDLLYAFL